MPRRSNWVLGMASGFILVWLCVVIGLAYVLIHFISKFW